MNLESAKVTSGYVLGSLAFLACLYFAGLGPNPVLQILFCLSGASLGWLFGIVITPLDEGEKKQFSDYAKGVSALISGFAIAKFDVLLTPLSKTISDNPEVVLTRGLLALVCFFVALLFTFIGRRYIHPPEEAQRQLRLKYFKEVEDALTKLAGVQ